MNVRTAQVAARASSKATLSADFCSVLMVDRLSSLISHGLSLHRQQSSSNHEQVDQGGGDLQAVQVLGQASIAHLLESEYPLDHTEDMFDLGAHTRLCAVLCLLYLIDSSSE